MSELKATDDSADELGGSGDSPLPPDSDNWLVDDFLQARALAQHANVMARLDAFAAAHGAAADDDPDSSSAPTGSPTAQEPDLHLAGDDTMPFGLRLQRTISRDPNIVPAGFVQGQGAQLLFDWSCGGGGCHSAPKAPPPPPTYFPQKEGDKPEQSDPPPVYIDPNKYPEAAGHAKDAQAAGAPSTLTVDRPGAGGRRRDATSGTPSQPDLDRDEYPPAVTAEGGRGASVRTIGRSDNRGAGGSFGQQITNVPDGSKIKIVIAPRPTGK